MDFMALPLDVVFSVFSGSSDSELCSYRLVSKDWNNLILQYFRNYKKKLVLKGTTSSGSKERAVQSLIPRLHNLKIVVFEGTVQGDRVSTIIDYR